MVANYGMQWSMYTNYNSTHRVVANNYKLGAEPCLETIIEILITIEDVRARPHRPLMNMD